MPEVHPRGQILVFDAILNTFVEGPGLQLPATTIGEPLEEAEKQAGANAVPHEPPEYFQYRSGRNAVGFLLIGIHVYRDNEEACIKQDLAFRLLPSDKIVFGHLGC